MGILGPMRMDEEKRRAARIQFRLSDPLSVQYKFVSKQPCAHSQGVFEGGLLNLSQGGALFVGKLPAAAPDHEGDPLLEQLRQGLVLIGMNILLPNRAAAPPIKVLASLRWSRKAPEGPSTDAGSFELGVQFEQLDPNNRSRLERFLASQATETRKLTRPQPEADLN